MPERKRRMRHAGLVAAAAVVAAAAGSFGVARTARSVEPLRPNVLLLVTDDQTMSSVSLMPYLSSRPFGHWVEFRNAYDSTPMCCPSRATIFTGQYAFRTGVTTNDGTPFDDSETLAVWLDRAGYRTGLIGKYLNEYPFDRGDTYIPPGWSDWNVVLESHSEADYYRYQMNDNGTVEAYGSDPKDYETDVLTSKAIDFIDEIRPGKPFFLEVAYRAPHRGATGATAIPAPRHQGAYAHEKFDLPASFNERNVSDKPRWVRAQPLRNRAAQVNAYRREAETMLAVDDSLERMIRELYARGQLDNTVIVLMTDNGFLRGQHRWVSKQCPYVECVQTPLLVRYPETPGRVETRLVSNVDIAPTIADLAQASPSLPEDGRSLVPLLDGTARSWRDALLLDWRGADARVPNFRSILTRTWQYTKLATGEEELYDRVKDPYELVNVASERRYAPRRRRLARRLRQMES